METSICWLFEAGQDNWGELAFHDDVLQLWWVMAVLLGDPNVLERVDLGCDLKRHHADDCVVRIAPFAFV